MGSFPPCSVIYSRAAGGRKSGVHEDIRSAKTVDRSGSTQMFGGHICAIKVHNN